MSKTLLDEINRQWTQQRAALDRLNRRVDKLAVRERAEVAGGVPIYATAGALPSAGQLGRLAAVAADNSLRFDNGTAWVTVAVS